MKRGGGEGRSLGRTQKMRQIIAVKPPDGRSGKLAPSRGRAA
jgi:hypothetical protein